LPPLSPNYLLATVYCKQNIHTDPDSCPKLLHVANHAHDLHLLVLQIPIPNNESNLLENDYICVDSQEYPHIDAKDKH